MKKRKEIDGVNPLPHISGKVHKGVQKIWIKISRIYNTWSTNSEKELLRLVFYCTL